VKLPPRFFKTVINGTERLVGWIERHLHVRWNWLTGTPARLRFHSWCVCVAALLLALPLGGIPFTNTLPGLAVFIGMLGIMERDGLAILFGYALLVGLPKNQEVAALLADYTTQLGTPTFIWRMENLDAENLYLVRVAPHRLDLSSVPKLKKQFGGKVPPLRWQVQQYCNGCGLLAPEGTSIAAKDASAVIPYTIDPRKDKRGASVLPDFPETVLKDKNDWEDCGHTFSWKGQPSPRFDVGKEPVSSFKPVVLRLEINECGD